MQRTVSGGIVRRGVGWRRRGRQVDTGANAHEEQTSPILRYPKVRGTKRGRLLPGHIARLAQRRRNALRVADPAHLANARDILDHDGPCPEFSREPAHVTEQQVALITDRPSASGGVPLAGRASDDGRRCAQARQPRPQRISAHIFNGGLQDRHARMVQTVGLRSMPLDLDRGRDAEAGLLETQPHRTGTAEQIYNRSTTSGVGDPGAASLAERHQRAALTSRSRLRAHRPPVTHQIRMQPGTNGLRDSGAKRVVIRPPLLVLDDAESPKNPPHMLVIRSTTPCIRHGGMQAGPVLCIKDLIHSLDPCARGGRAAGGHEEPSFIARITSTTEGHRNTSCPQGCAVCRPLAG